MVYFSFVIYNFDGDGKTDIGHIRFFKAPINVNGQTIPFYEKHAIISIYTFSSNFNPKLECIAKLECRPAKNREVLDMLYDLKDETREIVLGNIDNTGKTRILISPKQESSSNLWCVLGGSYIPKDKSHINEIIIIPDDGQKRERPYISWDQNINISFLNLTAHTNKSRYILQDLDGDGHNDFIAYKAADIKQMNAKAGTAYIHIAQKGGLTEGVELIRDFKIDGLGQFGDNNNILTYVLKKYMWDNNIHFISGGNMFNSQNPTILIMGLGGQKLYSYQLNNDKRRRKVMSSTINSLGIESSHQYHNIVETWSDTYTINRVDKYPYSVFRNNQSLLLLSKTSLPNKSIDYKYDSGVIDLKGRGFISFREIQMQENFSNPQTTRRYTSSYDPLKKGVLVKQDTPSSFTSYSYNLKMQQNTGKHVKLTLGRIAEQDKLNQTSILKLYDYDNMGNPTRETIMYGETHFTDIHKTYRYGQKNKQGVLIKQIVSNHKQGEKDIQESRYNYDSELLHINQEYSFSNGLKINEIRHTYDEKTKDLVSSSLNKFDSPYWLTSNWGYDNWGRTSFEITPTGERMDYKYDPKFGMLEEEIRSNKRINKKEIITYYYDSWNTLKKKKFPDSNFESYQTAWNTTSDINEAIYKNIVQSSDGSTSITYYDNLNREVKSSSKSFDDKYLSVDTEYDKIGRIKRKSSPYKDKPMSWTYYSYDKYDRPSNIEHPNGKYENFSYGKLSTTIHSEGTSTTKIMDILGNVSYIKDGGGVIQYKYRADNNLNQIIAPGGIVTSFKYDKYGRQIELNDPSAGISKIFYDEDGNISKEIDEKGAISTYKYDNLDRILEKNIEGKKSIYTYNHNLLESVKNSDNTESKLLYSNDNDQLLREEVKSVDGVSLVKEYGYNSLRQIEHIQFSSNLGKIVKELFYYKNGTLIKTQLDNASKDIIWQLIEENNSGIPTKALTGNILRTYGFSEGGLPSIRRAVLNNNPNTIIQDFSYRFDPHNEGNTNLQSRKDNLRKISEHFKYDPMSRLIRFDDTTVEYDERGNILNISDVGEFGYKKNSPYAISVLQPFQSSIDIQENHKITYNSQNRPISIIQNNYATNISYDINGNRVRTINKKDGKTTLTRYYLDNYEKDLIANNTIERLYLDGDGYSSPAVYIKEGTEWKTYYILRDYLGSITHIIDGKSNKIIEELSYDAWGRLRDPKTHQLYSKDQLPKLFIGRGYTGHEHLPQFGLINMNARLYDPAIGRFLSPDPYVQAPFMSQNFNRYSYALNNPLKYTDPNGEFFWIPFAIGFGLGYGIHGLSTGDWGVPAVMTGVTSGIFANAAFTGIAQASLNSFFSGTSFAGNLGTSAVKLGTEMAMANLMPSLNVPLGNTPFSLNMNPFSAFTSSSSPLAGVSGGMGFSLSYQDEKFAASVGFNLSTSGFQNLYGGAAIIDGKRVYSYNYTRHTQGDKQSTGTFGSKSGKSFSVQWENDAWAVNGDRYRSNAVEIGFGKAVIGTNVYTNSPSSKEVDKNMVATKIWGKGFFNKGSHPEGYTSSSPFYVGRRSSKGTMRIGWDNPFFGDLVQNGVHALGFAPYFNRGTYNSPFFQYSTGNRHTLY